MPVVVLGRENEGSQPSTEVYKVSDWILCMEILGNKQVGEHDIYEDDHVA